MKWVGNYRMLAWPGMYVNRPFFGLRQKYLPIPKRTFTQILVPFLGEMMWINVDPDTITLA